MKLSKILILITLVVSLQTSLFAQKKPMNINFKNLEIEELIKITSKILGKNILLNNKIPGKVDFVSNKVVYEEDAVNILIYVLAEKGYTLVDNNGILRIVRLGEASKYNLPVFSNGTKNSYQMVTNVFELQNLNVDYVASKVVHLIGKSARVVTDKKSNSLIVTDFVDNIKTIKKVINYLSKDKEKDLQMIALEYVQAADMATELKNLAKSIFDQTIENQKVDIFINKDTNSIILIGKKQNNDELVKYLKKVDIEGSLAENVTEVIGLKNTEAKSTITLLNSILGKKVYKDPSLKPFVAADEETNTIVLMGPKSEVESLKQLIDKLDIDRPQVYVKAQIIEVSDTKAQEIGIQYGIAGGGAGSDGLAAMSANLGNSKASSTLIYGGDNSPGLIDLLSSGFAGIEVPDKENLSAIVGLNAALNLLKSNGALEILSEPSILAINNKESSIYVGQRRSIKTGVTGTGDDTNTNYSREDIGLTLSVKPRISNDSKVILEVKTLLEGVDESIKTADDQPVTTKKEVKTSAIVNNGESVILGGLIQNRSSDSSNKIPLLGDIPVLGQLFRNDVESNDKVSLVVILTPYIVSKSSELSAVRRFLAELSQIEAKVLKDLEIRRKQNLIEQKIQDIKRDEKHEDLDEEIKDYDEEIAQIKQEKKAKIKALQENQNQNHRHPENIRQMFNL